MAVYAAQADVENAISVAMLRLIADHDDDGAVNASVVSAALSEASALAETYLAAYLPVSPVPDVLRRAVVDIAIELMRRGRNQSTDDSKEAYKAAIQWLRDVSAGKAVLGAPSPAGVIDPGDPQLVAEPRAWSRSTSFGVY